MKDAYWFKHDSNARHDPAIILMRGKYKAEGYGLYWMFIEALREAEDYKIQRKHLPAFCLDFASDLVESFLDDCLNEYDLFKSDGWFFWSESLLRRMEKHENIKTIRAEAGRKGGKVQAKGKQKASKTEAKGKHLDLREEREKDIKRDDDTPKESGSVCDNGHNYHGSFCRQCIKDEREAAAGNDGGDEL